MIIFQLIQKPQLRGAEMFAAQLSQELEKSGHTVFLIALFPGESVLPFSGTVLPLNRPIAKRWTDFEGWKQFAILIEQHQPDVIQCNAGDTLKFAVSFAPLENPFGCPKCQYGQFLYSPSGYQMD